MITSGLFETTVFWVGQWMARAVATGQPSRPMSEVGQSLRMGWGIFHLFATADDEQVFIGVTSNAHWERFCADARLAGSVRRRAAQHQREARRRAGMDAAAHSRSALRYTSVDLQAMLEKASVPYAPLRRPDQLLDDPHLKEIGQLLADADGGRHGSATLPKLPVHQQRI